jgi:hypothetical protein
MLELSACRLCNSIHPLRWSNLTMTSSKECFGLHNGAKQRANLGDGNGWVDERARFLCQRYQNFGLTPCPGSTPRTFQHPYRWNLPGKPDWWRPFSVLFLKNHMHPKLTSSPIALSARIAEHSSWRKLFRVFSHLILTRNVKCISRARPSR